MVETAAAQVSAFSDDALGQDDAVELARRVRSREVSPQELLDAAVARIRAVDPALDAMAYDSFDRPRLGSDATAALFGVPTVVKDNSDVAGMPSNHGSDAFTAHPARRDGAYVAHFLSSGMTVLGKSRLPEFGFSASSEFEHQPPVRNPWATDHTVGASSGGAAALVASGALPIAHANDGGGSIRIPAACAGLVGLKPSRGRHIDGEQARSAPINMVSEGVVSRSVRDTAAFVAALEDHWRNPALPPIWLVEGPARRRLRVGLVLESVVDAEIDAATRAAVERAAAALERAGHVVEPVPLPVTRRFADDFVQYWGLLADLACTAGKLVFDRSFSASKVDPFTRGLRSYHRAHLIRTPGALHRLRQVPKLAAAVFARHEVMLSPVLSHPPPPLGVLSPTVAFDELLDRLMCWVSYTPLNNIAGTPAISLPLGRSDEGLPVGVQLSTAHGDERTLLELAFLLEAEHPFATLTG